MSNITSTIKKHRRPFEVPEDHRTKGVSILRDADGNPLKEWEKTERASNDPPAFPPVPEGHLIKKTATFLDGQGQVRGQWVSSSPDEQSKWDAFWAASAKHVEAYRGLADPVAAPIASMQDLLTLYPLGDPHVGMLAWARETGKDFDMKIAESDLIGVVDMLVDRAPPSARAILANLGDFFHIENDRQTTPRGDNKLDGDSRLVKLAEVGFTLMRRMVERMLEKHAAVEVINVRGNHDPMLSCMLALWLRAVFEKEPRVMIHDNVNPYTYIRHGKNLIGFAHGDGAKPDQLPAIMAHDRAADWGDTTFRAWITGHIHHQVKKEQPGCTVESFRTLAPADYWHHHKGYRSGNSLCAITFDREFGEDVRVTVPLSRVRLAKGTSE